MTDTLKKPSDNEKLNLPDIYYPDFVEAEISGTTMEGKEKLLSTIPIVI